MTDLSRSGSERSADPRATRTRQGILDAVARLTTETGKVISVTEVVREAGISRSSFYAHFASLDDLAIALLRQEFAAIAATGLDLDRGVSPGSTPAREGYTRLIDHLANHQSIYSNVLGLPVSRRAYDEVIAASSEQLLSSFVELGNVPHGVLSAAAAKYVTGGTLMLIGSWITGELAISKSELVDQLVALLPAWLD